MNLHEIGLKHNTDKATYHNFCDFYQKELPKNPKRILEIGVMDGASLKMWKEYYPKAEVIGIDIKEPQEINGALWLKVDATDINALKDLGKFDIIIDDGSHLTKEQQISFNYLFENSLNKGGYYVMEDLHTSFVDSYINSKYTTYEVLQGIKNVKYHQSKEDKSDSFTAIIKK